MPHLSRVSSINLNMLAAENKKKRGKSTSLRFKSSDSWFCLLCDLFDLGGNVQAEPIANVDYMPDYGLFEASRIACPVLPQYHPKQLMELLNSGKTRWVKAILAHLVR